VKTYDIAVIGGGISGLIAALESAQAGQRVVLLEKSGQVGGRGITVNRNGALFNLGGHAIYRGGEAYSILKEHGVKLEGGSPSTRGTGIWKGKVVPLSDPVKVLFSSFLSWSAKLQLAGLLSSLGKVESAAIPLISLREWAEREIRDPMVRHLFYALARTATYTFDPDHQTAGPALRQVQSSLKFGVQYLDGGWQTIVDQLRVKAVQAGVDIMESCNVSEIELEQAAVRRIVLTDGRAWDVAQVISTASPTDTYRMVRGAEETSLKRWKEEARPARVASLDLCLKRIPVTGRNLSIGIDRPIFFSNHSAAAKLSDGGNLVVHLTKYNGTADSDPKADQRMLEQTMTLLHPDWEREVVTRQYLPNITVVHDYPHLGRKEQQIGPAVPEIQGLYVAGDWVNHGELLLDAAGASARRAARLAVKERRRTERPVVTGGYVAL
jgi:phytoene dehydrogenase-like protein